MFQKEKIKDPLDSDEVSNDDEEDIQKLLMEQRDQVDFDPKRSAAPGNRKNARNAKIDLKAYKPGKSIDYNIKVLRSMINKVKQATNTNRSTSEA